MRVVMLKDTSHRNRGTDRMPALQILIKYQMSSACRVSKHIQHGNGSPFLLNFEPCCTLYFTSNDVGALQTYVYR